MHTNSSRAMRRRLVDAEGFILRDRRLLFLDAAHVRPSRTAVKQAGEHRQLRRRPDGVDLHAPVLEIAGVACEAEFDGGALRVIAITDALHTAANAPSSRFGRLSLRLAHRGQVIVYRGELRVKP